MECWIIGLMDQWITGLLDRWAKVGMACKMQISEIKSPNFISGLI